MELLLFISILLPHKCVEGRIVGMSGPPYKVMTFLHAGGYSMT